MLCLQETWIEDSKLIDMAQFHIDNYHLLAKNRYASAHGGLSFYIHKNWNFKEKLNISVILICNEVRFDFSMLSSDIKSKLISTYCMELYGSQLWNYGTG